MALARQVEKLARYLARWHAKLKHWQAVWHVSTLTRKNEKLSRFWHVGTQKRWHVNHADTQARWHVDHFGTQAHMARNLANSYRTTEYSWVLNIPRIMNMPGFLTCRGTSYNEKRSVLEQGTWIFEIELFYFNSVTILYLENCNFEQAVISRNFIS